MQSADANAFTIVFDDSGELPSTQELRQLLEKGTDDIKIDTLRKIIVSTLNGNAQARPTSVRDSDSALTVPACSRIC